MKLVSTSMVEQVLFFYVHQVFPDAISRYIMPDGTEIDIYIPSISTGIEYDGYYWHKDKLEKDREKNNSLLRQGIFVIRIREKKLKLTYPNYGEEILLEHTVNILRYDSMCVEEVMHVLGKRVTDGVFSKALLAYCLTEDQYTQNLPRFYSYIFNTKVDHNLTDFCGIELWDDSNYPLLPENIPVDEWAYAKLKCKDNQLKVLPRYHRDNKSECRAEEYSCAKCLYGNACHLLRWCERKSPDEPVHCNYMERYVHELIENDVNISGWKSWHMLIQWLFSHSDIGVKLVKEILELPVHSEKRKKYYHFLHIEENEGNGVTKTISFHVWNDEDKIIIEQLAEQLENTRVNVYLCNNPAIG